MSGKLLLKLDAVAYLLSHHTADHYAFLSHPANTRNRTTFYATLSRLLFMDDTPAKFKAFIAPLQLVCVGSVLWAACAYGRALGCLCVVHREKYSAVHCVVLHSVLSVVQGRAGCSMLYTVVQCSESVVQGQQVVAVYCVVPCSECCMGRAGCSVLCIAVLCCCVQCGLVMLLCCGQW